ncbi:MAG: lactoylglutathione lyase [Gammaproteobacteria bacterium]
MSFNGENQPGVYQQPDPQTQGYVFNHTMLRVKDPAIALDFYTRVMGMRLLRKLDFPEMQFSLYFLAMLTADDVVPEDIGQRTQYTFGRQSVLELTHNWGSETQADFHYHDGNAEPQGFGHICFSVPDLAKACQRFEELGVSFVKKPDQGKMKDVAFIKDADGYWIEIVQANLLTALGQ